VATKFALEGIADALRLELVGSGVHVVLIEPGPIDTPFRRNSILHFERHIDWRASPHRAAYENGLMKRLYAAEGRDRFQLPPAAVTARMVQALEAPRPRARYFVTKPTYAADLMRRLLPTAALDRLLRRS
jgi:NAD(P)-dependent dehydrogenase (short-subunit alcohol dehydrogenase family)